MPSGPFASWCVATTRRRIAISGSFPARSITTPLPFKCSGNRVHSRALSALGRGEGAFSARTLRGVGDERQVGVAFHVDRGGEQPQALGVIEVALNGGEVGTDLGVTEIVVMSEDPAGERF